MHYSFFFICFKLYHNWSWMLVGYGGHSNCIQQWKLLLYDFLAKCCQYTKCKFCMAGSMCERMLLKWQPYVGLNFSIVMFHLFPLSYRNAVPAWWKWKRFSPHTLGACECCVSCDDEYVLTSLIRFIRYTIYRDLVIPTILWPMAHWLCIICYTHLS